jgi:hypothetical protein
LDWSSNLAYAAGLVATDGFLTTRNVVGFSSTDLELVETFLRCIDRPIRYKTVEPERQVGNAGLGIRARKTLYIARCSDPLLYDRFLDAGITPRKSLSLGPVEVPPHYFFDLVRGLLDGDGSVMSLTAAPHGNASEYRLRRLRLAFYSGSQVHLEWLHSRFAEYGIRGSLHIAKRNGHALYHLIHSDRAAETILTTIYEDPRAPRLERKWRIWQDHRGVRGTPNYQSFL